MNSIPAETKPTGKQENPFLNLIFNIIIPVYILNNLSIKLGPQRALLLAVAFPLLYGAYDFLTNKHFNWISLLGLLNIGFSGGLALSGMGGIVFAVKEMIFPLLIGVFVFFSASQPVTIIEKLFLNPKTMDVDRIRSVIEEKNLQQPFKNLLKNCTRYMSFSFLISAILNFVLALYIFTPIDPSVVGDDRSLMLNEQLARMTKFSFPVIMLPSLIITGTIIYILLKKLSELTQLPMQELMKNN